MTNYENGEEPTIMMPERPESAGHRGRNTVIALVATGALLWGGVKCYADGPNETDVASADEVTPSPSPDICEDTWPVAQLNNDQNRVVGEGITVIGEADTDPEAREAAQETLDMIKADPEALAGYANIFNHQMGRETEYKATELHDGECMTEKGEEVAAELEAVLVMSEITPEDAPEGGINSGVDSDGNMVQAEHAGLTGNRKAIRVDLPNGEVAYILERCGNVVVDKEILEKGPTDQEEIVKKKIIKKVKVVVTPSPKPSPTPEGHGPAAGPPKEAKQKPHPAQPTEGYEPGRAEKVVKQQESETPGGLEPTEYGTEVPDSKDGGKAPGGGDESVTKQPAPTAPKNPSYQPGTESEGTNEGTSNNADSEEAETKATDETSSGDPGGF